MVKLNLLVLNQYGSDLVICDNKKSHNLETNKVLLIEKSVSRSQDVVYQLNISTQSGCLPENLYSFQIDTSLDVNNVVIYLCASEIDTNINRLNHINFRDLGKDYSLYNVFKADSNLKWCSATNILESLLSILQYQVDNGMNLFMFVRGISRDPTGIVGASIEECQAYTYLMHNKMSQILDSSPKMLKTVAKFNNQVFFPETPGPVIVGSPTLPGPVINPYFLNSEFCPTCKTCEPCDSNPYLLSSYTLIILILMILMVSIFIALGLFLILRKTKYSAKIKKIMQTKEKNNMYDKTDGIEMYDVYV